MLKIVSIFFLFTCINFAFSESCTKYDFEDDFESLFSSDSLTCQSFSSWQIGNYTEISVRRPNFDSTRFISPVKVVSQNEWQLLNNCIRSFGFPMGAGGTVEIMFYIEAITQRDLLYVTASKIMPGGNDVDVAFARYSMANLDYKHGWNILNINIGGTDPQFDGYIYFFGTVTDGATILVDSFRYIGPNGDNENCELELITESETESPTTIVNPDTAVNDGECTTYDFENDYDILFNNGTDFCIGSLSWELQTYASFAIDSPHIKSNKFIAPANVNTGSTWQTYSSCISSFKFAMVEAGSLEVILYMEAKSLIDILYVEVKRVTSNGDYVSIASDTYSMYHVDYKAGWKALKLDVRDPVGEFEGLVSFLGVMAEGSKLFIDSFRYVSSTINEESCEIYTDEEITTTITTTDIPTTESPTTTDEPTTETTTVNPTTTEEPTTEPTTVNPTTTENPTTELITSSPSDEGECITYDFEDNFDSKFTNESSFCIGFPSWELDGYTNIDLVRPHVQSNYFITPTKVFSENVWQTISSCATSFPFLMKVGGIIEVKFYMEAKVQSDNLLVAASNIMPNGYDVIVNLASHSPIDPDYKDGWNTLRIEITNADEFEGYLLFLGTISENAVLIVDSFRYIGPSTDEESCVVYADAETTTPIPTTEDPTTNIPTTDVPTTDIPTTDIPTTDVPITEIPTTDIPTTTTEIPTTTTEIPITTTEIPITEIPTTTSVPTTDIPTTTTEIVTTTTEIPTTTTSVPTTDIPTTTTEIPTTTTEIPTTTTSIPTTDVPITTTNPPVEEDLCVTYDFENNFDSLFTHENYLCVGFTTWQLGNYSLIGMNGFDESSDLYMTPNEDLSCIASFPFSMSPGGTVEVNVFMDPVSNLDYITVLAKILVPGGVDTVAGMNMYNPTSAAFVTGWNVLRITIASLTDFNGYLQFLGGSTDGARVIVDSFRYIPPGVSLDHGSCAIY